MGGEEEEQRRGPWIEEEDIKLAMSVKLIGERRWDHIAQVSGLKRSGKSCRLRWMNYLHPDLKHGRMTAQEECLVLQLHARWGNKWSQIARRLPGRTDNEIKNYWRTHLRKEAQERCQATSPSCFQDPNSHPLSHSKDMEPPNAQMKDFSPDNSLSARSSLSESAITFDDCFLYADRSLPYLQMDENWIANPHDGTEFWNSSHDPWDYYTDSLWNLE
ncbi:myb-related protein MYBAS1-like [Amborella trichopoda]|uniref:myb-related protein MYBAS1-like n=1 Tax=Amborella trichopoda TaxID=13333 RepID=UPI0005D2FF11|nr:myb-related protein MYBAS1-like [Amborella trichopoda]|eukprot:XP_011620372.1 myb-related protein MYBAS1-like [Amborella trichopoda]